MTTPATSTTTAIQTRPARFIPRVFISHSERDNDFGIALAHCLAAEVGRPGAVWYDVLGRPPQPGEQTWTGGLVAGDYWMDQIVREIAARNVVVVLLTPDAVASPWVQEEIRLAIQEKNDRTRAEPMVIIPVLRQTCDVSKLLGLIQYITYLPGNDARTDRRAYTDLLAAIRRGKTDERPATIALGPPLDFAALPNPERFVGRVDDLAWAMARLRAGGGSVTAITAVSGLGGIGKSALAGVAVRRLYDEGRFHDGVVVADCLGKSDALAVLRDALLRFVPPGASADILPDSATAPQLATAALRLLRGKDALLVFDNVEPELDANALLAPLRETGVPVLLTARHGLPVAPDARRELALLPESDARDLFASAYGLASANAFSPTDRAAVERIITALDRHTLAVRLAAAEAADLKRDLAKFAAELETQPLRITGSDGQRAVEESLLRSIRTLPTDARRLFAALAVVPTPEFGRNAAIAIAAGLGIAPPEDAVDLLVRRALLDTSLDTTTPEGSDRERLRLHPLLRALAANMTDDATAAAAALALAAFYADYAIATPDAAKAPDAENIAGMLDWAHASAPDDARDRLVARLCMGMRNYWRDRWRTYNSLRCLPWGIDAAERIAIATGQRDNDLFTARLQLAYATALLVAGKVPLAEEYINQSLTTWREEHDLRSEGVALGILGDILRLRGDLAGAQANFERYLRIMQDIGATREEGVALGKLGSLVQHQGRLDAAEIYFQQSLTIRREAQDQHGEGVMLSGLGQIALRRGQFNDAERYFQESLVIAREVQSRQGEGMVLAQLGVIAKAREQWEEAEAYYRQGLIVLNEVQDAANYAGVAMSCGELLILHRGNRDEGCALLQQAIAIYHAMGVPDEAQARETARRLGCDVE
ncbi:MAG: hypothetical protein OJF49_000845 [Ktedonobacterales bacterium]|jgi:tetratricopeptide (TPR) repeat protein|nr:MAG: hypothetical protein OJF49_000845 [Ktedonobacterales bacterium]